VGEEGDGWDVVFDGCRNHCQDDTVIGECHVGGADVSQFPDEQILEIELDRGAWVGAGRFVALGIYLDVANESLFQFAVEFG
jgi:hypothetical protein